MHVSKVAKGYVRIALIGRTMGDGLSIQGIPWGIRGLGLHPADTSGA